MSVQNSNEIILQNRVLADVTINPMSRKHYIELDPPIVLIVTGTYAAFENEDKLTLLTKDEKTDQSLHSQKQC